MKDVGDLTDAEIDEQFSTQKLKSWIRKADPFLKVSGSKSDLRALLKRERDRVLELRRIRAHGQAEQQDPMDQPMAPAVSNTTDSHAFHAETGTNSGIVSSINFGNNHSYGAHPWNAHQQPHGFHPPNAQQQHHQQSYGVHAANAQQQHGMTPSSSVSSSSALSSFQAQHLAAPAAFPASPGVHQQQYGANPAYAQQQQYGANPAYAQQQQHQQQRTPMHPQQQQGMMPPQLQQHPPMSHQHGMPPSSSVSSTSALSSFQAQHLAAPAAFPASPGVHQQQYGANPAYAQQQQYGANPAYAQQQQHQQQRTPMHPQQQQGMMPPQLQQHPPISHQHGMPPSSSSSSSSASSSFRAPHGAAPAGFAGVPLGAAPAASPGAPHGGASAAFAGAPLGAAPAAFTGAPLGAAPTAFAGAPLGASPAAAPDASVAHLTQLFQGLSEEQRAAFFRSSMGAMPMSVSGGIVPSGHGFAHPARQHPPPLQSVPASASESASESPQRRGRSRRRTRGQAFGPSPPRSEISPMPSASSCSTSSSRPTARARISTDSTTTDESQNTSMDTSSQ